MIFKNQVRYLVHFTAPTVSVFDCYRLKQTGGTQHVRGGGGGSLAQGSRGSQNENLIHGEKIKSYKKILLNGLSINFQVTNDFPAFWLVKIHCLGSDSHWWVTIAFCFFSYSNKFKVNFYEFLRLLFVKFCNKDFATKLHHFTKSRMLFSAVLMNISNQARINSLGGLGPYLGGGPLNVPKFLSY